MKSSSEKENQAFIDLLKSKLDSTKKNQYDKGVVIYASDGIAAIAFLPQAKMSNVITFSSGETGIIMNLERDFVLASILGDSSSVKEGDFVTIKSDTFKIKTGLNLLGRVLNGLGDPIDGLGEIVGVESEVEKMAPGVMTRKSVHEPIQTGILAIDALIPIGRGQRELIIGDRKTGKTSIAIDAIINQAIINKDKDDNEKVYSVYVAIGQKLSSLARIVETLKKYDAMKYTVVISSTSSDSAAMQYFAPYVGCSIAEFFRDNKMHSLIVYDDLSKHAVAYRQMSLLLKRQPSREAYPSDVFYIHSKLLERSAKLSAEFGSGSMTSLPIIETQAGDVSGYIPTNVISITDGQIFLETSLFLKGIMPAINVGLSVSRVGSAAQVKAVKKFSSNLKLSLAQFRELEAFSQFASDMDESSKLMLARGEKMVELLKQNNFNPISMEAESALLLMANKNLMDFLSTKQIKDFKSKIIQELSSNHKDLCDKIEQSKDIDEDSQNQILEIAKKIISTLKDIS